MSKTKKLAIEYIRNEGGYKYNKEDDLWENDAIRIWLSIEPIDYLS